MRDATRQTVERLARLGERLGLHTKTECTSALLEPANDCVLPRHDLVWSHRLTQPARRELERVLGRSMPDLLPIVGFEVEGTQPTTKTMQSDALSLVAAGVPLGVVMVTDVRPQDVLPKKTFGAEGGERNIYRRCARVIRSLQRAIGAIRVVPADSSWLEVLERTCDVGGASGSRSGTSASAGSGGEMKSTRVLREAIQRRGESAGFRVVFDWTPDELQGAEAAYWDKRKSGWGLRDDPFSPAAACVDGAFTKSKIDIVWMQRLPPGISAFLRALKQVCPDLTEIYGLHPEHWCEWPIVGFELESGEAKHAGGGMLTLGTYCGFGVTVALGAPMSDGLVRRLATLKAAFGLPRVVVQGEDQWAP